MLGHGVIDNLATAGYPAMRIASGHLGIDKHYKNRRPDMWLEVAERVKKETQWPTVRSSSPSSRRTPSRFSTASLCSRQRRSPDLADALAHTFALPDQPNEVLTRIRGRQTVEHDFDPFSMTTEQRGEGDASDFALF